MSPPAAAPAATSSASSALQGPPCLLPASTPTLHPSPPPRRHAPALGSFLAASADGCLRLLDAPSLRTAACMRSPSGAALRALAYSAAHNVVATAGAERAVLLWAPQVQRPVQTL